MTLAVTSLRGLGPGSGVRGRRYGGAVLWSSTCVACGRTARLLCDGCRADLRPAPELGVPGGLDGFGALLSYEGAGRAVVTALKYGQRRDVASTFGPAIAALVDRPVDAITWLPAAPARRRARGYDQARLLARAVGRGRLVPVRRLLGRRGAPQTGRSAAARADGPALAACRSVRRARVLVVDDVVTTGASMRAAAGALRAAGAASVTGVALARTPLKAVGRSAEVSTEQANARSGGPGKAVSAVMQPTEQQVQRSLAALRAAGTERTARGSTIYVDVPDGLLDLLLSSPPLRLDRMAEAMRRLAGGQQPSDDDLARRLVGRLVCDRLR